MLGVENEIVGHLIDRLEAISIHKQLPAGLTLSSTINISDSEISTLAGCASILSLSEESHDISIAYEIMTRLVEFTGGEDERVLAGAELIFSRIGNFPGRKLLYDRHFDDSTDDIFMPSVFKLECITREAENTAFPDTFNPTLLTDFQYKFFKSLKRETALSISAPTSAGKSFVLNLDLVRRIISKRGQSIVYVVPTRALIAEVSQRIRTTVREAGLTEIIIRTAPFPVARDKIGNAAVYVLTQERLMSFITSTEGEPFITTLIVDEAHEIQNGKRGIILQSATEIALSKNNEINILFASPLIKNPGYFLSLFEIEANGSFFVEEVSPVSQNIILVSEVKFKPKEVSLSLLKQDREVSIGNMKTQFNFRASKSLQRANFVATLSSGTDSVISFSNDPTEAEKVAKHIAKLSEDFILDDEVLTFIDFIKKEVHPEYPLIKCIQNGVAFHYGNMPSLVRSGVEGLFKNGQIKIICCTSTLLQGVNLPAKHIVIENPKSGNEPMTRANFLNLAGRAGRLLKEFHGNIWCIRPDEWESKCLRGERLQEISSAVSLVMNDGGLAIQEALSGKDSNHESSEEAEAVFSKLYHDYAVDEGLGFAEKYRSDANSASLDITLELVTDLEISLPLEVTEHHQSLRPDFLQKLYQYLNSASNLENAMLLDPHTVGAKARMEEIIIILSESFGWEISDKYRGWITLLAYRWIWGESLGKILSERVSFLKEADPSNNVSSAIRNCLKVLESAIRFRLVKYFAAYTEILKLVCLEKGSKVLADSIEPYHIYLEFGSSNRHALNLMALGLSRFTALHLQNWFDLSSDVEAEAYIKVLSEIDLKSLKIPELCKKEISDLFFN